MKNIKLSRADDFTYTNGGSPRSSGDIVVIGNEVAVLKGDVAASADVAATRVGVVEYARVTGGGTAWSKWDAIYFDSTANKLTKVAAGNTYAGLAYAATADGDALGRVLLNAGFGQDLGSVDFSGFKCLAAAGVNSTGGDAQVTLTGTVVGDRLIAVFGTPTAGTGAPLVEVVGTDFEATVSVVDKIVQLQAAGDLSANTYVFLLVPAA